MHLASKLPDVGTSIFSVMSSWAQEHHAINLGQGFPDFSMDERLTTLVAEAMRNGLNQYAPMPGHLPLRESIAAKIERSYQTTIDPASQITITPGGTYAIYTSLTSFLQKGDEVILFEPAYDSYIPNILVNGAIPVPIALHAPDFTIDWNTVKEKVNDRTRAIIINTPHNPTGTILSKKDIEALRNIVEGTSIVIISDEVYEHLIYDGAAHESILRYPDLLERSFVCFSFGKVYHCTGWKLGYCVSSPRLMQDFRKLHQFHSFSCHTPSQVALATFLSDPSTYDTLSGFMQQKRDLFIDLMRPTKFDLLPSRGSYFVCATYDRISDEKDLAFAKRITQEVGVAAIPLSAFYSKEVSVNVLRFCFAKKEETLIEAAKRLETL